MKVFLNSVLLHRLSPAYVLYKSVSPGLLGFFPSTCTEFHVHWWAAVTLSRLRELQTHCTLSARWDCTPKSLTKKHQSLHQKLNSCKDLKWLLPCYPHHKAAVSCFTVGHWLKELKQEQACKCQGFPLPRVYNEGQGGGPRSIAC